MRGFEFIAIIIGIFFAVGIAVGVVLIIALPLLKSFLWNLFRSIFRTRRASRVDDRNRWGLPAHDDDDQHPGRWLGK